MDFKDLADKMPAGMEQDAIKQDEARLKEEADKRGLGSEFDQAKAALDQATGQATAAVPAVPGADAAPTADTSTPPANGQQG